MSSLLARAAQTFRGVFESGPVVSDAPPTPLDTCWAEAPRDPPGSPPWAGAAAAGQAAMQVVAEATWDRCPDTGAVLPSAPWNAVGGGPHAWAAARRLHRHQWFSTLARARRETGEATLALGATGALGEWIIQDVPGRGVAWVHAGDAAARLVHWALGAGWLGDELDPDLRRRLAGSVLPHAEWLLASLSLRAADLRLLDQAVGLVVAGLAWPDLPGARRWWSTGLTLIGRHLERQLHADGSPVSAPPAWLARTVSGVLIARAFCREHGVAFPTQADAALGRAAWYLRVLSEGTGSLPPVGAAATPDLLAPWGLGAERTAWNAVVGLGLVPGEAGPEADQDATAALLSGAPVPAGAPLPGGKDWAMWAFRGSGCVVLRGQLQRQPSRLVLWCGGGGAGAPAPPAPGAGFQVLWDVGQTPVLVDPGAHPEHPELRLAGAHGGCLVDGGGVPRDLGRAWGTHRAAVSRARVDGRAAAVVAEHDAFAPLSHERDLRLDGAKLVVTDRFAGSGEGQLEVRWPLGPGFEPEPSKRGYSARSGTLGLELRLDEALEWSFERGLVVVDGQTVEACVVVGRGAVEGGTRIRTSLEVR